MDEYFHPSRLFRTPLEDDEIIRASKNPSFYSNLQKELRSLFDEHQHLLQRRVNLPVKEIAEEDSDTNGDLVSKHPSFLFDTAVIKSSTKPPQKTGSRDAQSQFWAGITRFVDNSESKLYTRLLDVRQKLLYEIEYLKTSAITDDFEKLQYGSEENHGEDLEEVKAGFEGEASQTLEAGQADETSEDESSDAGSESNDAESESNEAEPKSNEASGRDNEPAKEGENAKDGEHEPRWITIHRVYCTERSWRSAHEHHENISLYLDRPVIDLNEKRTVSGYYDPFSYRKSSRYAGTLDPKGKCPIPDIQDYLKRHENIAFILYKDYHCQEYVSSVPNAVLFGSSLSPEVDLPPPRCVREEIVLASDEMKTAMAVLSSAIPEGSQKHWWSSDKMQEPYLLLYHYLDMVKETLSSMVGAGALADSQVDCAKLMMGFIDEHLKPQFDAASSLMERGLITQAHLSKLFLPEQVLVAKDDNYYAGYMCSRVTAKDYPSFEETKNSLNELKVEYSPSKSGISLKVASWKFDGQFRLETEDIALVWPEGSPIVRIKDLSIYPMKYDEDGAEEILKARAEKFWMCRRRSYICYESQDKNVAPDVKPRFMIDYETYRELHPDADVFSGDSRDDIGEEDMDKDEPPGRGLEYLFPVYIDGFAIQDKKWRRLLIDRVSLIKWNEDAFKRLVLGDESKELIQALIEVHMSSKRSADMIEGKGNGLLVLLHGPPGTGKTLTAESVAELVKRPLYRVTCGDIGTDAEGVEAYLESVLYIGKIWGCVILLDEADVFLEERSLADLQRNALVSVFLRVLEYYDGILILTSNRVGTFDEAFRSRIKLALHYNTLSRAERKKVWRNFFKTLREVQDQDVNYDDLDDHLDDLAEFDLNGREIRNAISTASELALFRKQQLKYHHLRHVIRIGAEFEKYLDKTRGETAEERMIDLGVRS
ncbi:hypothetical protein PFICI_12145 [Pestalotiopsis fici W106-1]|uniref:AAA+ ATPase domain-containing protein n=1 Tax=Pestalotiopsis fici (strain W106-1 / CGMCC3.15140) TaxID=1229662 RepID=W3WSC8_PESFW|nr:uncharacterized protein PFICI_12145 [Pestalotiopsis fici W106-1]ETS76758.1 hypothetical protein PFICI_12145 [Pestalotiopsis fici W106-1]